MSTKLPEPPIKDIEDTVPLPYDELLSTVKSLGKSPSKPEVIGKLREPETFTSKDPKWLKPFLFQCKLYFWNLPETFWDNSTKVNFALSYLRDVAQEWFEPGISGELDEILDWIDNWNFFVDELQTNFGPFDKVGDVEHELVNLRMKSNQQISEYLVQFKSLSSQCQWGEPALRHHLNLTQRENSLPKSINIMLLITCVCIAVLAVIKPVTALMPKCYVPYHRSNSISVSTRDALQTHS